VWTVADCSKAAAAIPVRHMMRCATQTFQQSLVWWVTSGSSDRFIPQNWSQPTRQADVCARTCHSCRLHRNCQLSADCPKSTLHHSRMWWCMCLHGLKGSTRLLGPKIKNVLHLVLSQQRFVNTAGFAAGIEVTILVQPEFPSSCCSVCLLTLAALCLCVEVARRAGAHTA